MKQRQSELSSESNSDEPAMAPLPHQTKIDPSLSPVTRRKHEFRLGRLQSEVMTRARSTLFGLGDVWKSKMNGVPQTPTSPGPPTTTTTTTSQSTPPPPRSPKNQNAVKNTFEFFFPRKNKEGSSVKIRKGNSENNLTLGQKPSSAGTKRSSDRGPKGHKSDIKDTKSNKSTSKRDDRSRRFSRNQSVDMSEMYQKTHGNHHGEKGSSELLSRSFDDGIHYLSDGCEDFRPRSYNDTFSYLDDFDNETRSIYDGDTLKRRSKNVASPRHILFNDEDDVIFFKSSSCPDKSGKKSERYYDQAPIVKPLPNSKDIPGILHTRNNKNAQDRHGSPRRSNSSKDTTSQNQHAEKIISARLKIQPPNSTIANNISATVDPRTYTPNNKVLTSYTKSDPFKFDAQDLHQDSKPSNPHRNISTVIIEEQERLLASEEVASRSKMTNTDSNRKIVKKQPSFDLEHAHASTLPRANSSHSNKKKTQTNPLSKRDSEVRDSSTSTNIGESRIQRSNSLDLELEVILYLLEEILKEQQFFKI